MAAVEKPVRETATDWSAGAAWVDGEYVPAKQASVSVFDWGFVRSDVTYDVVSVWDGAFFRLEDHLDRFEASVRGLRMELPVDRDGLRDILARCVRLTGLREAYVAMLCTRGVPDPAWPKRLPSSFRGHNRLVCYAVPYVWVMRPDLQERGAHMIISQVQRTSPEAIDPTIKNYNWGDLTRSLFDVEDAGADYAVLLGPDGYVTEGAGYNVFAVVDGTVVSPGHGTLEGITRMAVLDLCEHLDVPSRVGNMTGDDLLDADEIFLASTAGGVMPIRQINGRILSNGAPGPVTVRLRDAYWARRADGWHATPVDYGD